jgi:hypothetical protein
MTARGTWKASERRMATALGTVRVPVTGRQRGAAPDIAHEVYAIEHKYGQRLLSARLHEAIEQALASAMEQGGRIPLVTMEEHKPGRLRNECFVLMRLEDFLELTSVED